MPTSDSDHPEFAHPFQFWAVIVLSGICLVYSLVFTLLGIDFP